MQSTELDDWIIYNLWIFLSLLIWNSSTLGTSCEELTHWKRLWCWEGLGAGREVDNRGWDGWMASPTRWMWVWVNSESWWWTGRPGVLRFMGSQRVEHGWATELTDWLKHCLILFTCISVCYIKIIFWSSVYSHKVFSLSPLCRHLGCSSNFFHFIYHLPLYQIAS